MRSWKRPIHLTGRPKHRVGEVYRPAMFTPQTFEASTPVRSAPLSVEIITSSLCSRLLAFSRLSSWCLRPSWSSMLRRSCAVPIRTRTPPGRRWRVTPLLKSSIGGQVRRLTPRTSPTGMFLTIRYLIVTLTRIDRSIYGANFRMSSSMFCSLSIRGIFTLSQNPRTSSLDL